jgi:hypothetical protein
MAALKRGEGKTKGVKGGTFGCQLSAGLVRFSLVATDFGARQRTPLGADCVAKVVLHW